MSKSRVVKLTVVPQMLGAVMLLGLAAGQANAATYNWSFACGALDCSGSGFLETDVAIGPANVTSFTGTFGGEAITSLLIPHSFGDNDNIVYSLTQPEFSLGGITFSTASYLFNLFSAVPFETWWREDIVSHQGFISGQGDFSISPSAIPLPAALPLFAAGLSAMGFTRWRRKRKTVSIS